MEEKIRFIINGEIDDEDFKDASGYLDSFLDLFDEISGLEKLKEIKIEIKTKNEGGKNAIYEIKIQLTTDFGIFPSKKVGWNFQPHFREALDSIKYRVLNSERG